MTQKQGKIFQSLCFSRKYYKSLLCMVIYILAPGCMYNIFLAFIIQVWCFTSNFRFCPLMLATRQEKCVAILTYHYPTSNNEKKDFWFSFLPYIFHMTNWSSISLIMSCGSSLVSFHYIQNNLWFIGGSVVKESDCQCRRLKRYGFDLWVGKIPWHRKWQPLPVFLPVKFHWTEKPDGL